jgi:hypothetical protein
LAKVEGQTATLSIAKYMLRDGESEPTWERWLTNHELWSQPPPPRSLRLGPPRDAWAMYPQPVRTLPAGPGRLLLAASDWAQATLALVDTDENKPLWVQTRDGLPPFDSLTVDGSGRASVLTMGPWDEETMASSPSIEHYEADGGLAWIRALPAPWQRNVSSQLATDADGNIIHVGVEQNVGIPQPDASISVYVQLLSPDGDTTWAVEIRQEAPQGWANAAPAAIDKDGNIFVVGPSFSEAPEEPDGESVFGQYLYELSPDGERCRSHRLLSTNLERITIADNGDMYFLGWTFGRLMRK